MISDETREKLRAAGRRGGLKGGKAKVKKGFALVPKEAHLKASRKGAEVTNAQRIKSK